MYQWRRNIYCGVAVATREGMTVEAPVFTGECTSTTVTSGVLAVSKMDVLPMVEVNASTGGCTSIMVIPGVLVASTIDFWLTVEVNVSTTVESVMVVEVGLTTIVTIVEDFMELLVVKDFVSFEEGVSLSVVVWPEPLKSS